MRIRRYLAAIVALALFAAVMPFEWRSAQASARYYITVDLTNQIVTVYESGNVTQSGIVRQMICSSGKAGTRTPTGTYYLPSKYVSSERSEWYYFQKYNCYAKWATRITGGILFHSVLYTANKRGPTSSSVNALGTPASHGCIRLRVDDAYFIARNCLSGTRCRIYYSGTTNSSLRAKLKRRSFIRANETYAEFLGGSQTTDSQLPLQQGSTGALVRQLQTRLVALGFLNDTVDGRFGANTLRAVQAFESAAGLAQTTSVTQAIWDQIFAATAPTHGDVTLSEGSRNAAVADLQRALIALKILNDSADGIFGAKTLAAVRRYQSLFGYDVTGTATPALQRAILAHAARIQAQFAGSEYALTMVSVEATLARVKVNSFLNLRQSPSSTSTVLAKLENGTVLRVLEQGDTWIKVSYGSQTGYIQGRYVEIYTGTVEVPEYAAIGLPTVEPTVEPTIEPEPLLGEPPLEPEPPVELLLNENGAQAPLLYAAAPAVDGEAQWVEVCAGGATVYARPAAEPDGAIETLSGGAAVELLSIEGDWARVRMAGGEGWISLADLAANDGAWIYGDEPIHAKAGDDGTENGLTIDYEPIPSEDIDAIILQSGG